MRILIVKKIHEVQSACKDSGIEMMGEMDGESYRIEGRTIDVHPFGFAGFVSIEVCERIWNVIKVGAIYGLDFYPEAEPFKDHPSLKG